MSNAALASAREVAPRIAAVRDETEALRRLPDSIVDALVETQLFRLAIPSSLGGLELDPVSALKVFEELARAEASAAWLVWNSALPSLFGRFLSESARAEIFENHQAKYASSTRPSGRAVHEDGAYTLSGRWSLVSGCEHADWIGLMFMVEEGGELRMVEPGVPDMRMAFLPADACRIIDTWCVGGLRGTGSHDVVVEGLPVQEERTFTLMSPSKLDRPIGRIPIACTMSAGHAAICLGIASACVDEVVSLGQSKVSVDAVPRLPDRAWNQSLVAEATTKLGALRSRLHEVEGVLWENAEEGRETSLDQLADVWSAAVTTGRECRSVVDSMYEVAGSPALYVDNVLERAHRDIHAAMQHVVAQRLWLEEAGRVRFGMQPESPLFML